MKARERKQKASVTIRSPVLYSSTHKCVRYYLRPWTWSRFGYTELSIWSLRKAVLRLVCSRFKVRVEGPVPTAGCVSLLPSYVAMFKD